MERAPAIVTSRDAETVRIDSTKRKTKVVTDVGHQAGLWCWEWSTTIDGERWIFLPQLRLISLGTGGFRVIRT